MIAPPSIEDSGSFGAEIPQPGEAGAFYQLGHNLPNGLRINFTVGHIDRMPLCEATGLIVSFCRHCDDLPLSFHDGDNTRD